MTGTFQVEYTRLVLREVSEEMSKRPWSKALETASGTVPSLVGITAPQGRDAETPTTTKATMRLGVRRNLGKRRLLCPARTPVTEYYPGLQPIRSSSLSRSGACASVSANVCRHRRILLRGLVLGCWAASLAIAPVRADEIPTLRAEQPPD